MYIFAICHLILLRTAPLSAICVAFSLSIYLVIHVLIVCAALVKHSQGSSKLLYKFVQGGYAVKYHIIYEQTSLAISH